MIDDESFLAEFERAAIPSDRWTHREHIRVAFLYLRDHSFEEALVKIRSGIRTLNRANGVRESSTSGYHETVTIAWARVVVSAVVNHGPTTDFESFAGDNPHLLCKSLLRLYYSKERMFSAPARSSFVEPDLAPLPHPPGAESHREVETDFARER